MASVLLSITPSGIACTSWREVAVSQICMQGFEELNKCPGSTQPVLTGCHVIQSHPDRDVVWHTAPTRLLKPLTVPVPAEC